MNTEEGILLNRICNEYWESFGKLVAENLKKAPRHLQDELMEMLQDSSSCYGSNYSAHMERDIPSIEHMQSIMDQHKRQC